MSLHVHQHMNEFKEHDLYTQDCNSAKNGARNPAIYNKIDGNGAHPTKHSKTH